MGASVVALSCPAHLAQRRERPHPASLPMNDRSGLEPRTSQHLSWRDGAAWLVVAAVIYVIVGVAREWAAPLQKNVVIHLEPGYLPGYTFYSLMRGLVAYGVSFLFTMAYGWTMARVRGADRVMLPLLDILQSIPVLGFLPGFVLALVHLFPHENLGLELASILMIFTGQVWNMTFSFYHSLRAVPQDLVEVCRLSRLTPWQRFVSLDLSYAAPGLIWNSMMSMAGGWFFLAVSEAFVLGDHDFRLPGVGAYMSVAIERGDLKAQTLGVLAMIVMIVGLDLIVWRPVVAWAHRFSDERGRPQTLVFSWTWWGKTRLAAWLGKSGMQVRHWLAHLPLGKDVPEGMRSPRRPRGWRFLAGRVMVSLVWGVIITAALLYVKLVQTLTGAQWLGLVGNAALTFGRVIAAVVLATLWTVPAGVWIGTHRSWATRLQPVIQMAASFPAPMLYPLVLGVAFKAGFGMNASSVVLLLLGTQWYVLFNVIAGASNLPKELGEVCALAGLKRVRVWRTWILPAIFPSLVTGWITAMGGAWNASVVAEYLRYEGRTLHAAGLGATISHATEHGDFGLLAAAVGLMAVSVVGFNRLVWRPLGHLAQTRYSAANV